MKKWEYSVSVLPAHTHRENWLDNWGKDGWELCGITENSTCFFKREITESNDGKSE